MLAANEKARPDPRLGGLFSASRQLRPRLPLTGSLNSSESGNSEEKDHARYRHRPKTASRNRGPTPQQTRPGRRLNLEPATPLRTRFAGPGTLRKRRSRETAVLTTQ